MYVVIDADDTGRIGRPASAVLKRAYDSGGSTGGGSSTPFGGKGGGGTTQGDEWIEPVSYYGSCNMIGNQPGIGEFPMRLTEVDKPYCWPLLFEITPNGTKLCFRYRTLFNQLKAKSDPEVFRHYGGTNPAKNGSNWLFADGHVQWHSLNYATSTLICCITVNGGRRPIGTWQSDLRELQKNEAGCVN